MQTLSRLLMLCLLAPQAFAANEFIAVPTTAAAWARDISADGTTVVGEVRSEPGAPGAADTTMAYSYTPAGGLALLPGGTGATAHGVSADGSTIVGSVVVAPGQVQPYRWTAAGGFTNLANNADDHGVALAISADGSTVAGEYGAPAERADCGEFFCAVINPGSTTAFRWTTATGLQTLGTASGAAGSQATAVSATGTRIAGNDFSQAPACFSAGDPTVCLPPRTLGVPFLADNNTIVRLRSTMIDGDLVTGMAGDGSTLFGRSYDFQPFRWRDNLGRQLLGTDNYGVARASSADGDLIAGDFGVWRNGRKVALKPLLGIGLGLDVLGWEFSSGFSTSASFPDYAPLLGDAGITGMAADGLTWTGTAFDPAGAVRPFMVRLDALPDNAVLDAIPELSRGALFAATLPPGRVAVVGAPVAVFATLINAFDEPLHNCAPLLVTPVPVNFDYQATDPTTNALTGAPNTLLNIPPRGQQTLVLGFTPTAEFAPTTLEFVFDCANGSRAPRFPAVNDVVLEATSTAVPEILAAASTLGDRGVVELSRATNAGVFTLASINYGPPAAEFHIVPVGNADLELTLCESDPATALCLAPAETSLRLPYGTDQVRTFSAFVSAANAVPADFANTRIFVQFRADGVVRGGTSVAVASEHLL